jgi:cyclic beta-1,2-glucan synthetase
VVYANPALRADPAILVQNHRGQSGLWGYSISGDLPIVLLQISDSANIELVRQLVQAQAYWRLKGLAVDLMIWNDDHTGYRQELHEQILGMVAAGPDGIVKDRPGGIFVRPSDQIAAEDRILLQSVARVIISDNRGSLSEQLTVGERMEPATPELAPVRPYRAERAVPVAPRSDLMFYNGLGGFTPDGREYIITTTQRQCTPAPWVNILANPNFGTVVSESGQAYTWSENAHEFRLTPWGNDPVSDTGGETYYIRDEETGHFWSPTPMPRRGTEPYVSRHGFGYSVFEYSEGGITSEMNI